MCDLLGCESGQGTVFLIRLEYLVSWTGMSLSAGSSPLHSPKITPHTSPTPRRRSHTPNPNPNPNPANYMVPTTASDQAGGGHVIQKETVGGTTYFYTDNTPAPLAGMVWSMYKRPCCVLLLPLPGLPKISNVIIAFSGVPNLSHVSASGTSRGIHAAKSQCTILLYGWRTPTGTLPFLPSSVSQCCLVVGCWLSFFTYLSLFLGAD